MIVKVEFNTETPGFHDDEPWEDGSVSPDAEAVCAEIGMVLRIASDMVDALGTLPGTVDLSFDLRDSTNTICGELRILAEEPEESKEKSPSSPMENTPYVIPGRTCPQCKDVHPSCPHCGSPTTCALLDPEPGVLYCLHCGVYPQFSTEEGD